MAVRDAHLIQRLRDLDYEPIAGNRFARTLVNVPVTISEASTPPRAIIDVLVPAYTSRARANRRISADLVTTEVPGLAAALQRDPVVLQLELHRLNGERFDVELAFPDEVAALALKVLATRVRSKATDIADIWRCLEVAFAASVKPDAFGSEESAEAAGIVRSLFDRRNGAAMTALVEEQRLSDEAADQRFTRVRALIGRVLGAG